LAWYFFLAQVNFEIIFSGFSSSNSLIFTGKALFYFVGAVSAILATTISSRFNRKKFLYGLTFLSVICSFFIAFFQGDIFVFLFGPILGICLGLAFPASMSLLADSVRIDERGRVCGVYILQNFILLAIFIMIQEVFELGFFGIVMLLVLIRALSFLGLILDDSKSSDGFNEEKMIKFPTWRSIFAYRDFILYFVPWLLFLVVTVIADHILWPSFPTTQEIVEAFSASEPLQYVGAAVASVISGVLADRIGRKWPIIIGLVMLGVSFALLGLSIVNLTVFLHVLSIGIAFGFLMVVYTAIPGDLSSPISREKFYAIIVVVPFSIYGAIGAIPAIFGITASPNLISPFLGIVLFLSVIPIVSAKETLSSANIQKRKYQKHK
jgi:MFS family permease